jgi:SAM-dependent methyltransferase
MMETPSDSSAGYFRKLASSLQNTPIHPQWFAFFREERSLRETCRNLTGVVLDIGCAEAKPRKHLSQDAQYVGLDYYSTAKVWYGTQPDIYADAQSLPLSDASIDHSLLLDVLEHIPEPDRCLSELSRTLRPGGSLTIQVPFLYPVHDAPLDFHRWTRFGLIQAAEKHGFHIATEKAIGHPLETAALNSNIAISKTVMNWVQQRSPLALLALLLPLIVPLINLLAWGLAALGRNDDLMPYSYRMVWIKK